MTQRDQFDEARRRHADATEASNPAAVRSVDRTPWADAPQIDRAAAAHERHRRWDELWELACAAPVSDAVRAARCLDLGRWSPPDAHAHRLAERMVAVDPGRVARVTETAVRLTTAVHRSVLVTDADRVSFAVRQPAVSVEVYAPPGVSRIAVLDDTGTWGDAYVGPEEHDGVCCLGRDDVLAVRGSGAGTELVRYSDGAATVLGRGTGFTGARPAAVAEGFIVGLPAVRGALVCGFDVPLHTVDLQWLGGVRADVLAVDPTGTRVALGGERLVVLDWRLQRVLAEADPRGGAWSLAFPAADAMVTAGWEGGLSRWQLRAGAARPHAEVSTPPLSALFAVPAWRVVGGRVAAESRNAFFDPDTLETVAVPRPWRDSGLGTAFVHAVRASADGNLVMVAGQLWADAEQPHRSVEFGAAVHDLRHPLSWVVRPLASITPADAGPLAAAVEGVGEGSLTPHHPVSGEEREVLELVRAIADYRYITGRA